MISRILYYIVWFVIVAVLAFYTLNYKGGNEAMVAQVESEIMAVSYQKPVLVKAKLNKLESDISITVEK